MKKSVHISNGLNIMISMGGVIMVRETEISSQFGLEIYSVHPMKGVYLIRTNKGNKCLKKVNYGAQKLMYIYKAKEHVIQNGFPYIDKNVLTLEGNPYAAINDDIYILTEWIEGKECDYKKEEDLQAAARALATFHLSARNFVLDEDLKARDDIGKLTYTMEKRLSTLNKMRDMARKNKRKTEFDMLYLTNVEFYVQSAKRSILEMNIDSYNKLCSISESERVLCHHDFTYHNILIDKESRANIIDFDYFKSEIQIYDLCTFIIKSLKRLDWDKKYAILIMEAYNEVKPITKEELDTLKVLLLFPQRFWRLANRYYYKEASWGEESFTKKLRDIINEKEKYMTFLEEIEGLCKF